MGRLMSSIHLLLILHHRNKKYMHSYASQAGSTAIFTLMTNDDTKSRTHSERRTLTFCLYEFCACYSSRYGATMKGLPYVIVSLVVAV